jgi:hypothetical protein
MKGGSARPIIPFLKRIGFLGSDGAPTDRYKQFRNKTNSGAAAAAALREGFQALFEINESAHKLSDEELRGLIVQITGAQKDSSTVVQILGSFKALLSVANVNAPALTGSGTPPEDEAEEGDGGTGKDDVPDEELEVPGGVGQLRLGYTINLNLPATSDIAVFNAIFKSLREHILR